MTASGVGSNGALAALTSADLQALVRAVLRDVLPAAVTDAPHAAAGAMDASVTEVTLRTPADLDAFVRRVAALCDDPTRRLALQEGRHHFLMTAHEDGAVPAAVQHLAGAAVRIERGAVTERAVAKAARDGARLVLGRRAVLTPLARDKARSLGVAIEKEG